MFGFGPKVPQISVEEVKQSLDEKKDVVLLDVRTRDEFSRGRIAGSINVPVDEVAQKIESILPDKNKTVYVYCLSGSRSVHAVAAMEELGYAHIFDIKSGMLAWRSKKYPVST